ncbi:hypothetical protein OG896_30635 [Streptomyces sp. NBC_00669]|uniref:hypothetical protein n=1 Tax=Streptomyces sp. NBC_00669 TaxID=2976011 RepID=UPI002E32B73E|nr:hypothetical protein [Streptomyces sp. NBC_00669]
MRIKKAAASVAALAACALLLTACNDDTPAADGTTPPASASDTATPAPVPTTPPPTTPDGDKLKAALPTVATLPSGWTVEKGSEADSANGLADPDPARLPTDTCNDALTVVEPDDLLTDYRASDAYETILDPMSSSQEVAFAGFEGDNAEKLITTIKTVVKRCGTYEANTGDSKKVTTTSTLTPVKDLGDEAYALKVTPKGDYESSTDILVRSGNVILCVDAGSSELTEPELIAQTRKFAAPMPIKP